MRIDVDDKGVPWVINSIGEIFKREGDNWRLMPGRANDIGIEGLSVYYIRYTICYFLPRKRLGRMGLGK